MEWTEEYCGLSHLGEYSTRKLWVTVERFDNYAVLSEWFPGCQFSPTETRYSDVDSAKKAGEIAIKKEVK